jgi:hypothetical protein
MLQGNDPIFSIQTLLDQLEQQCTTEKIPNPAQCRPGEMWIIHFISPEEG